MKGFSLLLGLKENTPVRSPVSGFCCYLGNLCKAVTQTNHCKLTAGTNWSQLLQRTGAPLLPWDRPGGLSCQDCTNASLHCFCA